MNIMYRIKRSSRTQTKQNYCVRRHLHLTEGSDTRGRQCWSIPHYMGLVRFAVYDRRSVLRGIGYQYTSERRRLRLHTRGFWRFAFISIFVGR